MKLHRVSINNFRSIADQQIEFDPKCRILVGINESGKSNVLKALRFLSDEMPSAKDIRNALDEEEIEQAFVRFVFKFDEADHKEILSIVQKKVLLSKTSDQAPFSKEGVRFTFKEICNHQAEGLYQADLKNEEKAFRYFTLPNYQIEKGWKKPSPTCPPSLLISDQNGKTSPLNTFALIAPEIERDAIVEACLVDFTDSDVNSLFGSAITKYLKASLPDCVYWSYDEKYLLPAKVNLANFIADPSTCVPLENMFEMAGITDIAEEFEKAKLKSHGERNLLSKVARATTKHIKSVWREYKSIEILLEPNGDSIDASVKDKTNLYDFANRSDGFKRFVSFLLMISAKVKTNRLANTLILIDEPEIGLHPSGARYLLEELLKIADNNYVVFSTHSIFMIDREKVSRHIIVTKEDETTTLKEASTSNFQDEEVIYNALGYSIFSTLQESNLVFEGWKDKRIFQVAMSKIPAKFKDLKNKFQNIGVAHLQGVKDAGRIATVLDLANRNYLILSDDDNPAKEAQKSFKGSNGTWKRYSEIITGTFITGEDFIKCGPFIKAIASLKSEYPTLNAITDIELADTGGKLAALKKWLNSSGFDKTTSDEIIKKVKEHVSDHFKHGDIEESYYELLNNLPI